MKPGGGPVAPLTLNNFEKSYQRFFNLLEILLLIPAFSNPSVTEHHLLFQINAMRSQNLLHVKNILHNEKFEHFNNFYHM
jgi:hypothetical protein